MVNLPQHASECLPAPYNSIAFVHRRHGVFDDEEIAVFTDSDGGFAVLHPRPILDYAHYTPRQQKLGLGAYKRTLDVIARRFAKIGNEFPETGIVLEIGAADGGFLAKLRQERPRLRLVAVEPDRETQASRAALALAGDYVDLAAAAAAGVSADVVCLFHVFEHITEPATFLDAVRRVMAPGGRLIIEVPSLDDPLLSLYRSSAYEAFYFQRQHPYVYSRGSLKRVLEAHGWHVREVRPYQRYGLENHLGWLVHGKPGGDAALASVFTGLDADYRAALEARGATDTVFAIAETA